MAKLTKLINFLDNIDKEIDNEIYNRQEQADNNIDINSNWEDSDKGNDYVTKTEALDELRDRIYEVLYKAKEIKNGNYY
tara:strand:+ start:1190 stop:1426 length:237 start_codon:yes stop_codon:yes gene_type:complete